MDRLDSHSQRREYIDAHLQMIDNQLELGLSSFVYSSVYIEVDSIVDDEPVGEWNIDDLISWGLDGWQLVTSIPRTIGVALSNTSLGSTFGSTWGGGMGGNVVGAHLLLQLVITPGNREQMRPLAQTYFEAQALARFPD